MQPHNFKFSEKTIEKRNKTFWIMRLSMPIILLAFVFASSGTGTINIGGILGGLVFALIIIEAILFIEPVIIFAKWRQLEIHIADDAIERSGGKFVESVRFTDINRIVVNANKTGQVISIKVQSPSRALTIAGFEDMNQLSDMIEEGVSGKSVIQKKETPIDWENPLVTLATILVTALALIGLRTAGAFLYEIVMALLLGAFGIANLTYRPISRGSGERFKTLETVCGVIMVVASLLMLIIQIITTLGDK